MYDLESYNSIFLSVFYFLPFYSSNFEIILALQKSCKEFQEFPYSLPLASPSINVLCNHGLIMRIKKQTSVQCY